MSWDINYNSPGFSWDNFGSSHWGSGGSSLTQGGGGGMWPLALASLGSSVLSGIFGGQAANRQAQAEIAAAGMQANATRDAAFANLLGGQWAATNPFQRMSQQSAADYQQTFLDPRRSQLAQEDAFRGIQTELSPQAKKLKQQQNVSELNNAIAQKSVMMDKMFGFVPTRPFDYDSPGYTSVA